MGQTLEKSLIIDFYLPILRIIPVFSRIHLGDNGTMHLHRHDSKTA